MEFQYLARGENLTSNYDIIELMGTMSLLSIITALVFFCFVFLMAPLFLAMFSHVEALALVYNRKQTRSNKVR